MIPFTSMLKRDRVEIVKAITIVLSALLLFLLVVHLPNAIDWSNTYRPATRTLLSGQSPYTNKWFFNPPWALFPLIPLALLPEAVGRTFLFVISLGLFALVAYKLGAGRVSLIAFLLSPMVVHSLMTGNLDSLVLVSIVLPPQIGLFFALIKPQIGIGLVLYWLIQSWREGGFKDVFRVFAPATLALLLSFALFGMWPLRVSSLASRNWNASLWPSLIPVGLVLMVVAVRRRQDTIALAAGPTFAPYVSFQSWSASLLALAPHTIEMVVAVIGLWVMVFVRTI